MTCPSCQQIIEALKDEVQSLRAQLGYIQQLDRAHVLGRRYGLAPRASLFILALYEANGAVARDVLEEQLIMDHSKELYASNTLSVYAVHARRALGREAVETVWRSGYRLTPAGRAKVAEALAEAQQANAA